MQLPGAYLALLQAALHLLCCPWQLRALDLHLCEQKLRRALHVLLP